MNVKNVLTIAKKELRAYLVNVSNFLVLAGVLLVTAFLFFNTFYSVGVSQLDDLFGLFPWVFAILIPAVSMGVIAKERQEKTLYYLFAQPINEIEIILGKFIGSFVFLALFPLVTVIIPISLSSVAQFDTGVVAAGYVGTLFILGLFLSINLAVSASLPNPLAVFVVSFILNLLLILIGSSLVGNIVPQAILSYVVQLSPLDHFSRISRGLIELSDIGYFLLTTTAFLLFAIWRISLLRGGQLTKKKLIAGMSVQVLAIALIVGAYFSFLLPGRVDITEGQIFTLASGSQNIISNLQDTVTIDLYISNDLPPAFKPALTDIKRVVEEIKNVNASKVTVEWKHPDTDTAIATEAQKAGIFPHPFQVVSQTEYQAKEGYLGVLVKYGDKTETIPFVQSTSDFEYQLIKLIYDLTTQDKPTVALVYDSKNVPSTEDSKFVELLKATYDVKELELKDKDGKRLKKDDVKDVTAFVVIGLSQKVSDEDVKLILNKVSEGAGLIVFSGGLDINLTTLSASKRDSIAANKFLDDYKIQINSDIIFDKRNANLLGFTTQQGRLMLPYAFWPTVAVNSLNPLLKEYPRVVLKWGSSLSVDNEKAATLLRTGNSAGVVSENISLSPDAALSSSDLSQKIAGAFLPRTDSHGDVVVVGSDMLLRDDFIANNNELYFPTLLVDVVTQNNDLASIKAKNRIPAQLRFDSDNQKSMLRLINILVGPILVLSVGMIVWYLRRGKMSRVYVD